MLVIMNKHVENDVSQNVTFYHAVPSAASCDN